MAQQLCFIPITNSLANQEMNEVKKWTKIQMNQYHKQLKDKGYKLEGMTGHIVTGVPETPQNQFTTEADGEEQGVVIGRSGRILEPVNTIPDGSGGPMAFDPSITQHRTPFRRKK